MPRNPLRLKVAYLYPDILKSFCDKANMDVFAKRAKWRDIEVEIQEIRANDKISASKYDFYYIGGSNVTSMFYTLKFLAKNMEELKIASASLVPMLAVNCGYMLFGNFYQLHNQIEVPGIKILDVDSIASKNHHYGNVLGTCKLLKNKLIVGFENHGISTYLQAKAKPFLTLQKGKGNNGKDRTEGAMVNNVIGTYITSPILAQNPHFCDYLLGMALRIKYKCNIPLTKLCDDIEWYSHNYMAELK